MKKVLYELILLFSISTNNLFSLSNKQLDTIARFSKTDPIAWDLQEARAYLAQTQQALPSAGRAARGALKMYEKRLKKGIDAHETLKSVDPSQQASSITHTTRAVATQTEPLLERSTRDVGTQTEPWLDQGAPETPLAQPEKIMPTRIEVTPAKITPTQPAVTPTQPHITPTQIIPTQPVTPAQPEITPPQPQIIPIQTEVTPTQPAVTPTQSIAPETLSEQKKKQPAPGQPLPSLATSVESEAHAAGIEFWTE